MISTTTKSVLLILFFLMGIANANTEIDRIEVTALLGNKAMLVISGQSRLVAVGTKTPEGIELTAIKDDGVELNIDGNIAFYPLGSSQIGTRYTKPESQQERVYRDNSGMFRTVGTINGLTVNFLVDTGASMIAMNLDTAKRLGINFLLEGKPTSVSTASGIARAWEIKLDRVTLGTIELFNVHAAVLDGNSPTEVLLGMSFLGRLKVQHQGKVMLLETKF